MRLSWDCGRATRSNRPSNATSVVVEIGSSWDWSRFADQFTADATYVEHTYGTLHGREEIRDWIVSTMNVFPGSEMPFYPTSWHSIDLDRGWVFCEFQNRMRDPGDGSIHQAANLSVISTPAMSCGATRKTPTTR
jgi:hypothetical protein